MTKIVIVNGYAEDGEEMALYANGKRISDTTIDGGNEAPETLMDFLGEFGVGAKACGITDIDMLDEAPELVTENRPHSDSVEMEEDEYQALIKAGKINGQDGYYEWPENLSDIAHLIPELSGE